jgi:uncharacterized protein YjbI with pentapeptide repeats
MGRMKTRRKTQLATPLTRFEFLVLVNAAHPERGVQAPSVDLSNFNLASLNLKGANLSGANLSGANLSGANLTSANLECAVMEGANLSGANLSGANFVYARLYEAHLEGAKQNDKTLWPNGFDPVDAGVEQKNELIELLKLVAKAKD